jgi:hypothetical protein
VALGVLRAGYNSGTNNDGDFPLHAAAGIAAVIGGRERGGEGGLIRCLQVDVGCAAVDSERDLWKKDDPESLSCDGARM